MRQVGEGAGGARDRDAEALVAVGLEESRAVARDLCVLSAEPGGDVGQRPFAIADAPQRRGAAVAQHRSLATREDRGEPSALTRGGKVADGVDAAMKPMPAPAATTARDRVLGDRQLPGRDHAVLTRREGGDFCIRAWKLAHIAS